jgi:hypothetical protein
MVLVYVALDACGFNLEEKDNETRLNITATVRKVLSIEEAAQ